MKDIDRYDEEAKKLGTNDKTVKKPRKKVEMSTYRPVPLYRSYGKTRREFKLIEELTLFAEKAGLAFMLGVILIGSALSIGVIFAFGPLLVKIVMALAIVIFFGGLVTRTLRARMSFFGKLKKLCRQQRLDLKIERSFTKSLVWDGDDFDFTVETPKAVYYVNMIASKSRHQKLCIDSSDEFRLVTVPPKKKLIGMIFDLKTKVKKYRMDYSRAACYESKQTVRALLMIPSFDYVEYKTSEISAAPTGSGGEHFGITLYTAKGFLNMLKRGG